MSEDPVDPNAPPISREPFMCPRRVEGGIDPSVHNVPEQDTWNDRPAMSNLGPHCSWCGSLHPDVFMNLIATGAQLGPTDKSYKAYISTDNAEDKFYYQHLNDEQKQKLVEMANAGSIMFGYPGYWYVLPFFLAKKEATNET